MNLKIIMAIAAICFQILNIHAAGLDNALNYKSPTKAENNQNNNVEPYSISDFIKIIPKGLYDDGSYNSITFEAQDLKLKRFNELRFFECKALYINLSVGVPTIGDNIFRKTLIFSFPRYEEDKATASRELKSIFAFIEDPKNLGPLCNNRAEKIAKIKELANSLIAAAPSILDEKKKQVQSAKAETEKAIATNKAQEQAAIQERKNKDIADKEFREKQYLCFQSSPYKLFAISDNIMLNRNIKEKTLQAIEQERNAAKISGYVNKAKMYDLGQAINKADIYIKDAFPEYKRLGGRANSIDYVQLPPNPCAKI